jgi:hypothetical protein
MVAVRIDRNMLDIYKKKVHPRAHFCNLKIESFNFVESVRQCYRCGKIVYISKFCIKEQQCLSDGKAQHE